VQVARAAIAEALGTMALLAIVVGSGIMGDTLAPNAPAVALLANAAATGAGLYVLIVLVGPISGAHFNPCVTLLMRMLGEIDNVRAAAFVAAQLVGAVAGVVLAHAMFDLSLFQAAGKVRTGGAQWVSEAVATGGLLTTIMLGRRHAPTALPTLIASYIFAAYWFTASTSFANPAVTLARSMTDTFAGIRVADVPGFVLSQILATLLVALIARILIRKM